MHVHTQLRRITRPMDRPRSRRVGAQMRETSTAAVAHGTAPETTLRHGGGPAYAARGEEHRASRPSWSVRRTTTYIWPSRGASVHLERAHQRRVDLLWLDCDRDGFSHLPARCCSHRHFVHSWIESLFYPSYCERFSSRRKNLRRYTFGMSRCFALNGRGILLAR